MGATAPYACMETAARDAGAAARGALSESDSGRAERARAIVDARVDAFWRLHGKKLVDLFDFHQDAKKTL